MEKNLCYFLPSGGRGEGGGAGSELGLGRRGVPRALPLFYLPGLWTTSLHGQGLGASVEERADRKCVTQGICSWFVITGSNDVSLWRNLSDSKRIYMSYVLQTLPNECMKLSLSDSTLPILLRSREQNKSRMNSFILHVAFVLSTTTIAYAIDSEAIGYFLRHPQEQFCAADFGKSWENILFSVLISIWRTRTYVVWLNL